MRLTLTIDPRETLELHGRRGLLNGKVGVVSSIPGSVQFPLSFAKV